MSVSVMGLAWYVKDLTPSQKVVLLALADHASDDGSRVYPGVERLTYKTSLSERTVRRALSDLREKGLLIVVKESTFHSATEYRIDLPEVQVLQERPARDTAKDLPETTKRPARDAPKPSLTINESIEDNNKAIYTELSVAFVNKTKIPELSPNPRKWFEALNRMGEAGVETIDIERAVDILRDRNYSIVGLSSVANTAISEMSKRKGKQTDQDRSKYVEGEYAEFIEH